MPLAPPSQRPSNGNRASLADPEKTFDLTGLHILAVDDEPDARELIRHVLTRTHASVTVAGSVAEALEAFDKATPHVLVSDIGMPEADGYSLIHAVRKRPDPLAANIPAIALTAYVREDDRAKMLAAGFTAHVPKPVEPAELIRVISHISGRTIANALAKG